MAYGEQSSYHPASACPCIAPSFRIRLALARCMGASAGSNTADSGTRCPQTPAGRRSWAARSQCLGPRDHGARGPLSLTGVGTPAANEIPGVAVFRVFPIDWMEPIRTIVRDDGVLYLSADAERPVGRERSPMERPYWGSVLSGGPRRGRGTVPASAAPCRRHGCAWGMRPSQCVSGCDSPIIGRRAAGIRRGRCSEGCPERPRGQGYSGGISRSFGSGRQEEDEFRRIGRQAPRREAW
jgi:hypothetical protein